MVFKKIIFQNSLMANETPSRPPPPFMANAILNFHFDYVTTSLTCFEKKHCSFSFRSVNCAIYTMVPWNSAFLAKKDTVFVFLRLALNNHFFAQSWQQM